MKTHALPPEDKAFRFSHGRWELVCDNTHTRHAVGYYGGGEGITLVSMLLTRAAGPNTPVSAKIVLCEEEIEGKYTRLASDSLKPSISLGRIRTSQSKMIRANDVPQLIDSVIKDKTMTVSAGDVEVATLSLEGAKAVLRKMGEYQLRLGTYTALVKKGKGSERNVLLLVDAPLVRALPSPKTTAADRALNEKIAATIDLKPAEEDCQKLKRESGSVSRLSKNKLLFSLDCSVGAYNTTLVNWIINDRPPFDPQFTASSEFSSDDASRGESLKSRGPGDCFTRRTHHFDGTKFVLTLRSSDACEGLLDGAWNLPSYVARVVRGIGKR